VTKPERSLVITRTIGKAVQTFVPDRFLHGVVPSTILEDYNFWQNEDDSMSGYYKPDYSYDSTKKSYMIHIKLHKDMSKIDETGFGWSSAFTIIQRLPLLEGSETEPDPDGKAHTLLNLLCAPPSSPLKQLAKALTRMESISHILVWTAEEVQTGDDGAKIDLVELPRMNLVFGPGKCHGATRLFSFDHSGWFLSYNVEDCMKEIFGGMPQSLLLENDSGDLAMMVAASSVPKQPTLTTRVFSTELLLDQQDMSWITAIGDVRHYWYPIHTSKAFVFTQTLGAALYLMLMRFLNRQYDVVFRI